MSLPKINFAFMGIEQITGSTGAYNLYEVFS